MKKGSCIGSIEHTGPFSTMTISYGFREVDIPPHFERCRCAYCNAGIEPESYLEQGARLLISDKEDNSMAMKLTIDGKEIMPLIIASYNTGEPLSRPECINISTVDMELHSLNDAGEFVPMEKPNQPSLTSRLEKILVAVNDLPKEGQDRVYVFLHDACGCRI